VARKILIVAGIVDYGDTDLNIHKLQGLRLSRLLDLFGSLLRFGLNGWYCWAGSLALQLARELCNHGIWIVRLRQIQVFEVRHVVEGFGGVR
jgi:hypothetical protein